jgi:AcrR family transcriptional regulator
MAQKTVDWTALREPGTRLAEADGLRERKKQQMRQQLSDTATAMFVERGFDAVRVVEIAAACGVSEKTVYNYFPTKESLVLDRWDSTEGALRTGLADPATPPVAAAVRIVAEETGAVTAWLAEQEDPGEARALFRRFGAMVAATPALRSHHHDVTEALVAVAAEVLAERYGEVATDPAIQIAAVAIIGLWRIQSTSLTRHLGESPGPDDLFGSVMADVEQAARRIDAGLGTLGPIDGA